MCGRKPNSTILCAVASLSISSLQGTESFERVGKGCNVDPCPFLSRFKLDLVDGVYSVMKMKINCKVCVRGTTGGAQVVVEWPVVIFFIDLEV